VHDADLDEVDVFLTLGVKTIGAGLLFHQLADDDRGFLARILHDDTNPVLDRAAHDGDALGLVVILAGEVLQRLGSIKKGGTTAGNDAFSDGRLGRVQRVIDGVSFPILATLGSRTRNRPKDSVKGFWTDSPLMLFGRKHRADACWGQTVSVPQLLKALSRFKGRKHVAVSV
jgi:hypothetical protein